MYLNPRSVLHFHRSHYEGRVVHCMVFFSSWKQLHLLTYKHYCQINNIYTAVTLFTIRNPHLTCVHVLSLPEPNRHSLAVVSTFATNLKLWALESPVQKRCNNLFYQNKISCKVF